MYAYILQNQEIPLKESFRQDIFQIKELKNTGGASRADYTHNVMKKYVRFIASRFLTLRMKWNSNLFFIQAALQKLPK